MCFNERRNDKYLWRPNKNQLFYVINYNSLHLYNGNYVRDKNTLLSILNNVHFGYNAYGYLVLSYNPRLKSYSSLKQCVQFVLIRRVWLPIGYVHETNFLSVCLSVCHVTGPVVFIITSLSCLASERNSVCYKGSGYLTAVCIWTNKVHKILAIRLYFLLNTLHVSYYISPSSGATFTSCTSHLVYAGTIRLAVMWLLFDICCCVAIATQQHIPNTMYSL